MNLYDCTTCNKKVFITPFDDHITRCREKYCRIKEKINFENEESMKSTIKKLCRIVEKLSYRVEYLENMQTTQKRKRISDVLNERNCNIGWKEWLKMTIITEEDIAKLLKSDFIVTLKSVLEKRVLYDEQIPVAAFIQRENKLYIYDDGKWKMAKKIDYEYAIKYISSQFYKVFIEWSKNHRYTEFEKPFFENSLIVAGSVFSIDRKIGEIKKYLFCKLRMNLEKGVIDDIEEVLEEV